MSDEVTDVYREGFASIGKNISLAPHWEAKRVAWRNGLHEALATWNGIERSDIIDECYAIAEAKGLTEEYGIDEIQQDIADEVERIEQQKKEPPKTNGHDDYHGPDAEAEIIPPKAPTDYEAPDEASIPKRSWLYGGHYIRQVATATVAPGGYGKTTLTIYEAISMVAAGLTVWYLSGEDPKVELDRRIAAHCHNYGIELRTLPGHLCVDDRSTFPVFIGKSPRPASVLFDEPSLAQFETAINIKRVDVVMLDPFVSFHAVPENDNGCIDAVVKRLALIANRSNACIELSHHVRKPFQGQGTLTVDDSRGGGAIINAVRSGRVINRMSSAEAEHANIDLDQRSSYIRVDRGKRNMAPPDKATWFRIASVLIDNGDNVQALEPWEFPSLAPDITADDTEWVRELVRRQVFRTDARSDRWLGIEVARRLQLDLGDKGDCARINRIIGVWLANGIFKKMEMRDPEIRKMRMFYVGVDANREPIGQPLFDDDRDEG